MLFFPKFSVLLFLLFSIKIYSFQNKKILPDLNYIKTLSMRSNYMIDYLTSIKDYTIITDSDRNKELEELMISNDFKVYYVNVNNLLNKDEILDILKKNHNNLETAENLWVFHKGFFFGSRNDIYKLIKNKKGDFLI
jgi:hypothetical protein